MSLRLSLSLFFLLPLLLPSSSTSTLLESTCASSQRLRGLFKVAAAARERKRDLSRDPRHLDDHYDEHGGGEARGPNNTEAATIQLVLERRVDVLPRDDVAEGATLLQRWDREEAEEGGRRGGARASPRPFGSREQHHRDCDTRTSWNRDLVVQLFAEHLPPPRWVRWPSITRVLDFVSKVYLWKLVVLMAKNNRKLWLLW